MLMCDSYSSPPYPMMFWFELIRLSESYHLHNLLLLFYVLSYCIHKFLSKRRFTRAEFKMTIFMINKIKIIVKSD